MKSSFLILPLLMTCGSVLAQSPAVAASGDAQYQTWALPTTAPTQCPVVLAARQGGFTDLVKVKHGQKSPADANRGPRQRIHLVISKEGLTEAGTVGPVKVASATVTARGLSARSHMSNARRDGSESSDMRRTLYVKFATANDGTMFADLILPGFTAVTSIKLESITFADGSTRVPGRTACSVVPDPFMLVADR